MAMMRLRREDPRVVGAFRLHRRLGAGGMGVVYLGADKRGQRVALKVIRPELAEDQEFRSRFAREVSAARRIRGGCTARLVAADLEAERPWFATQYVPGPSLHDKVAEQGPLPAAEVAAIGAALAEGLVAVHEAGVVHRDLKPSNILLSPKGPRIIDFGIAWATGASTLTHVGTAVGSPGFLAPEQVRGQPVTPATDVFAFGATLAYAATADSPFGQGSSEVMLYRVVHEEPDLGGVPDALAPLVYACLAKDPHERPSTVQLSERLAEIAAREARGIGSPRIAPGGPVPKAAGPRPERPVGRLAEEYAQQRTVGAGGTRGPGEGGAAAPGRPGGAGPGTAGRGARVAPGGRGAPGGRSAATPVPGQADARRRGRAPSGSAAGRGPGTVRTNGGAGGAAGAAGAAGRGGTARGAAGSAGSAGAARGGGSRLVRQRLVVFVVFTVLAAVCIAAVQGCRHF